MSAKQTFHKSLGILIASGTPLIMVRTREPYQTQEAIEEFVQAYNIKQSVNQKKTIWHHKWSRISGWTSLSPTDLAMLNDEEGLITHELPKPDGTFDLIAALGLITGRSAMTDTIDPMTEGVFTLMWPQDDFNDPLVKAILLDYANELVCVWKRLVLVVPESVMLPKELQDFISVIDYDVPQEKERLEIIVDVCQQLGVKALNEVELQTLSASGAGMTNFELSNSVARAVKTLEKEGRVFSCDALSDIVLKQKTELVKRSEVLEVMAQGKMSEIGGLTKLKEWIKKRKNCFSEAAKTFGVSVPKGIALIGPPGTGKSACGKAIGHELGLPVIKLDVSSVFNSYVGSSEERIRSALKLVAAMSPCVVFLDEIDKLFDMNSGGGDSGVSQRVLGSLLTFLQENTSPIFWVFTANRVEGLPPEMLRKGRLDEIFSVTVPNPTERREIFAIHLKKRNQDIDLLQDFDAVVQASEGYTAAEIEAIVKEAVIDAFCDNSPVTSDLLIKHLRETVPQSIAFKERFNAMKQWAEQNAKPSSEPDVILAPQPSNTALSKLKQRAVIDV